MPQVLILRFDAPLISFGGVIVDENGVTRQFPGCAMLTGLLANALGYDHCDFPLLQALQQRLRYAVRCDLPGREIADFQTVDLSPLWMRQGWTTRGIVEGRAGGTASTGTHIRHRRFIADSVHTISLTLIDEDRQPTLDDLEAALREPARPLFIGRKPCLPSEPILCGRVNASTLLGALESYPLSLRARPGHPFNAWWPGDEDVGRPESRLIPITDERDWRNQIHVSRRWIHEGIINVDKPAVDD
ncbi:MAG: type I-E CRISPR-associated protein Cas5/CasD [Candidatus Binatus sp.]|uniref:type I-E CRISPR-associated protein Cas5/CasD n=1 Tax=Candidatus Binatus sp. TaxID=2811406 RepID=UPI002726CA8E|nr:type I-E CRISPR-associated protein Cas5/CasD [Candidatus Binatus sp.]MDO8434692.1 type I-E CRISPR-associated protein Cas5/CasD [Candidatus Binatus sp.]